MEININSALQNISQLAQAAQAGEVAQTGATGDAAVVTGAGVVVTDATPNGTGLPVEFAAAELTAPRAMDADELAANLATFGDKLNDMAEIFGPSGFQSEAFVSGVRQVTAEFQSQSVSLAAQTSAPKNVMVNIFELMALMQKCNQELMDSAHAARQSANAQAVASIHSQAELQRTNAMTGLICAAVSTAVSLAVAVGTKVAEGVKTSQAANAKASYSADAYAKAENATLTSIESPGKMDAMIGSAKADAIKAGVPPDVAENLAGIAAKPGDDWTPGNAQTTMEKLTDAKSVYGNNPSAETRAQVRSAADAVVAESRDKMEAAGAKLRGLETGGGSKTEIAKAQKDLAQAQAEFKLASTAAAKLKGAVSTPEESAKDVAAASKQVKDARAAAAEDPRVATATRRAEQLNFASDIVNKVMSGVDQSLQSGLKMLDADVTDESARTKEYENMASEAGDLLQSLRESFRGIKDFLDFYMQSQAEFARKVMA